MGASITLAGETLIAQKHAAQQGLDVVRFIFANVPGLDPVRRSIALPANHQQGRLSTSTPSLRKTPAT